MKNIESRLEKFLGKYVTAKLLGKEDCRQGWVISSSPFIIIGQSGENYGCEGNPTIVLNPPNFEFTPGGCLAASEYLKAMQVHISTRLTGWSIVWQANYLAEHGSPNRLREHEYMPTLEYRRERFIESILSSRR